MLIDDSSLGFEWDQGNISKNQKHQVDNNEAEEAFFDPHKKILKDKLHSAGESRYILLGQTKHHRILFIVFTKRQHKIRVISARDINRKEVHLYEKTR